MSQTGFNHLWGSQFVSATQRLFECGIIHVLEEYSVWSNLTESEEKMNDGIPDVFSTVYLSQMRSTSSVSDGIPLSFEER
jgi:hypothetical protein